MDDKNRNQNPDEFWNIEVSRPKRKLRRFAFDTGTVEIEVSADKDKPADTDTPVPRQGAESSRIPPRQSPAAAKQSTRRVKPTLDDLLHGGYLKRGSELEPLPQTAVERLFESAARKDDTADDEPQVSQPPISAWKTGDTGEPIPQRADAPQSAEPYLCYTPDDNKLIKEVRVFMWPSPYTFYERFRSDARKYHDFPAKECRPAPFFSFMPQYVQLTADQRAWYFYWRSLVREGKYPSTDFGYVMLYIYELINLTDMLEPAEVLRLLCDIWLGYRNQHPRLDRYLSEWVSDLCFIHRLTLPYEKLAPIYPQIISASRLKEFYVGCSRGSDLPFAEALLSFNSGYDWQRSKYITDENRHLFEEHIRGAFLYACRKLESADPANIAADSPKAELLGSALRNYGLNQRVIRDAYSGALCSYEIKRRIEVHYYSCTRSPELRNIVTDMIKCAENNVRAMLGIKSRFSTPNLPIAAKNFINEYFAPLRAKPKKKAEDVPEYEKYYEAANTSLSPEAALALERSSWETTRLLVDAFEDGQGDSAGTAEPDKSALLPENGWSDADDDTIAASELQQENHAASDSRPPVQTVDTPRGNSDDNSDFEILCRAYTLLREGNSRGFASLADSLNMMPETLSEKLNEYAYEIIGDIAVEPDGLGSWQVIPDYAAELDEHFRESNGRTKNS